MSRSGGPILRIILDTHDTHWYPQLSPVNNRQLPTLLHPIIYTTKSNSIQENGHHIVSLSPAAECFVKSAVSTLVSPSSDDPKIARTPVDRHTFHKNFGRTLLLSKIILTYPNHHLESFVAILKVESEHQLAWNLSISNTQPVGMLRCLRCSTTFPWNNRCILKR